MKLIEKMKSRLADLLGTIPEHKGDAVDSVLSHLLESDPGLNFTRAARVNERPGFTRVVRAGIAYYAKRECKVLNPFKEGGNGVYFVKGCNDDPTGIFFTDTFNVDDVEYSDAIAAYLFAYGIPRDDLVMVPSPSGPGPTSARPRTSPPSAPSVRPSRTRDSKMAIGKDGSKVMSLRLPDKAYRRLHAYGVSKDLSDSAAARELIAAGLASDGLALYSTELGTYLRGVMQPLLEQLDHMLDERNAEQEDRIARVVHRATRASIVAAIAAVEIEKGTFEGLDGVSASDIYAAYDKQAGLMQRGMTLSEARERLSDGKS